MAEAWIPIAVLRTSVAKRLLGGIAAAVRSLLGSIFFGTEGLLKVGISLRLERPQLLLATFGNLLGDEAALKQVWSAKGASGLLCCWNCTQKNVVLHSSMLADHGGGYLVSIACAERHRFDPPPNFSADHGQKHDGLSRRREACLPPGQGQLCRAGEDLGVVIQHAWCVERWAAD